jgi:RNA polymerase sigma factor (sigma-70 family)
MDRLEHPDLGDAVAERVAQRDAMWLLLRRLPKKQRAVVVLRYYEDLPDSDIAELLGCSPSTVRVHAFKALGRLRAELGPGGRGRRGGSGAERAETRTGV